MLLKSHQAKLLITGCASKSGGKLSSSIYFLACPFSQVKVVASFGSQLKHLICLYFCLLCPRNLIQPEQCSYSFTPSRIDITLKKRHSQRWGGLEAPATQGLHLHSINITTI